VLIYYWIACSIGYQHTFNTQKHIKCGHVTENIIIVQLDSLLENHPLLFYWLLINTLAICSATAYPLYVAVMGLLVTCPLYSENHSDIDSNRQLIF